MSKIGSNKREQQAINKINNLIDQIENAHSNISCNDKHISWDGTIDFYRGITDKKENFDFSIDVQVKGRTKYTKSLGDKNTFNLDVVDLKNYLFKDGTLLLCVYFLDRNDSYKIYYAKLLPYDIMYYLKRVNKSGDVNIKLKELVDAKMLKNICLDFNLQKNIQKKLENCCFDNNNLEVNGSKISKISFLSTNSINVYDLVGTEQYLYEYNEYNSIVKVRYGFINEIGESKNLTICDKDKMYVYDECKIFKGTDGERIEFGKSFVVNLRQKNFKISLNGTLSERIKDLYFLESIISNEYFLINNNEFKMSIDDINKNNINKLLNGYLFMKKKLEDFKILVDPNLDNWKKEDFFEFELWFDCMNQNKTINLRCNNGFIGSKKIKDVNISVFGTMVKEGQFKIETLWNNIDYKKYHFKYVFGSKEICSNNLYLNLNYDCYLADDININQMIDVIELEKKNFKSDDYILVNLQLLEVIKAYDKNNNNLLLDYAEFLSTVLLEQKIDIDGMDIYFINYCQILKRKNRLTDKEKDKLIKIRNKNVSNEYNLSCNLLLDNFSEVNYIFSKMSNEEQELFKDYPISIYIK